MEIKKEKAQIIFKSEDKKEIIINATHEEDDSLTLNVDFGKNGSKNHKGLYVAMFSSFMDLLKS